MNIKQRVAALRGLMNSQRIHAYIIPSTDAHQSEYVPDFWRRREWISGFTGSAGDVVVTGRKAALWTDGRYFLQAEAQLAGSGIALMKLGIAGTPSFARWLAKDLKPGSRVGVDARLFSVMQYGKLKMELNDLGLDLVSVEENLVDKLWTDRPHAPDGPIQIHPLIYSGERFQDKLKRLRKAMAEQRAEAHVVAALDCIAWLFNIRGTDVQDNPVVIAYAIVTEKDALLFVDEKKVTPELKRTFGKSVLVRPYENLRTALATLAKSGRPVWIDPGTTNRWISDQLESKVRLIRKESPIVPMKAAKNTAEIRGARNAHVRDGVAVVKFLHWLDENLGKQKISEVSVSDKLIELRGRSKMFRGPSFDTIAGYGEHGAIIHYSATPETDVLLKKRGLFLIDSGGQYLDGTTDITRTVALGAPTREQKEQFTRVLKGHIGIALASFPTGTAGRQIDTLARKALWDVGLDYGHGTGHGVGSYLSVHEGPQSISPTRDTGVALEPGMVLSNEPGYYAAGSHGIRIENLVYVVKDKSRSLNGRTFLTFENLTLCPIDLRLIDERLLIPEEIKYLNAYHARVRKTLNRFLDKKEAAWLAKATRPIR